MSRRAVLLAPLFLLVSCAEPLDPGSVDIYVRQDGGRLIETSTENNNTDEDTGAPDPEDTATSAKDSAAASPDTATPAADSAAIDTAAPDTTPPDTGTPDTGTPDTAVPPMDTGVGTTVTFPAFSDTFNIKYDPNFWNLGDFIQGSRPTALPSITTLTGTILIDNAMTCGTLALNVTVNSKVAGTVTITSTSGNAVPMNLTFPAVTGPTYVLRYQAGNTIKGGCGVVVIDEVTNKVTLK